MQRSTTAVSLRAEIEGQWGGRPPSPERYIDLSYYQRALALSGQESLGL